MTRPANSTQRAWLCAQKKALILWMGDPNKVPIGFAPCDGQTYNGTVTKNMEGLTIRTPPEGANSYGQINNNSSVGNDILTENSFRLGYGAITDTHPGHTANTKVTIDKSDGEHEHSRGNYVSAQWRAINASLYNTSVFYGSNDITTATLVSTNGGAAITAGGLPLEGTVEDNEDGHTHSITLGIDTEEVYEENSGNSASHTHDITGGDDHTKPAQFAAKWIVWVGYE